MKQFLVNLLIAVALGLCGLCTYQWYREARLRTEFEAQSRVLYEKKEALNTLDASFKRSQEDVFRLDKLRVENHGVIRTNTMEIASLSRKLEQAERLVEQQKEAVETYKNALEAANANVLKANDDIKKQNETIKQLVAERTDIVEKYKGVVKQYEDLVKQFEAYQAEVKKAMEAQQPKKN